MSVQTAPGMQSVKADVFGFVGFMAVIVNAPLLAMVAAGRWPVWALAIVIPAGIGGFIVWMRWLGRQR